MHVMQEGRKGAAALCRRAVTFGRMKTDNAQVSNGRTNVASSKPAILLIRTYGMILRYSE